MKHLICTLLIAFSAQVFAAPLQTVVCQPNKDAVEDIAFVLSSQGQTGLIKRSGDGLLSSDSCFTYKNAPKEVKQNLKTSVGIVALCVYITSDDGSGDLAVLTKEGNKYVGYFKQIILDSPNKEMGSPISCY